MAYVIFDLDGTVIDSTHRQATKADGSLDLDHWIEHNKPEMIARDSLLPLARIMRIVKAAGHKVIVCTARAYQTADVEFLNNNGLGFDVYLSRVANIVNADGSVTVGDNRGDAQLKIDLLNNYFKDLGFSSVAAAKPMMFDDNLKVIDAMISIGITTYDATIANRRLAA
jgi:phosphoglycolate phosphatase-like HAD superfamily hydrolase